MVKKKSGISWVLCWLLFCLLWGGMALLSFSNRDAWSFSTTTWLPGGILLFVLGISDRSSWFLWITSATLLHTLCGFYIGRPLLLAAYFALFDAVTIPLCALVLKQTGNWHRSNTPVREIIEVAILAGIIFISGMMLLLLLKISGYNIAFTHLVSWSLALLTSIMAFWPLVSALNQGRDIDTGNLIRESFIAALFVILMVLMMSITPPDWGALASFNPAWLLFSCLLMGALIFSPRYLGGVLVLHYIVTLGMTLRGVGPFIHDGGSSLSIIWNAQWYVLFSSWLCYALCRFTQSLRQQQRRLNCMATVETLLSEEAGYATFFLQQADNTLLWRVPEQTFFDDRYSVSTLALLEARSSPPFLDEFDAWLSGDKHKPFVRHLTLRRGIRESRCLLALVSDVGSTAIAGGVALIDTEAMVLRHREELT